MDALVFGNVTLDILCYPVNEVPRYESIAFEDVTVSPGGCGSNTAIGLAASGISTGIVARTGDDDAADLLFQYWKRVGVDTRFVQRTAGTVRHPCLQGRPIEPGDGIPGGRVCHGRGDGTCRLWFASLPPPRLTQEPSPDPHGLQVFIVQQTVHLDSGATAGHTSPSWGWARASRWTILLSALI